MVEVVFFDIDGTLTTESNHIPKTTIQALEQLKAKGIRPVLATGRPPILIDEISKKLDIHSYIAMNGQYIVLDGEVIYANPIAMDLVDQVVEFADARRDGIILCAERELILNSKISVDPSSFLLRILKRIAILIPERTQMWFMNQAMRKAPKKEDYSGKEIFMMNLNVTQAAEKEYAREIEGLHFTRANPNSMDIINEGVSKATAVQKVLDHLSVDAGNTVAFGDGLNDLEMLQYVGTGVAMGNGFEELKEAADMVTANVGNAGIQKALKKLGLID